MKITSIELVSSRNNGESKQDIIVMLLGTYLINIALFPHSKV